MSSTANLGSMFIVIGVTTLAYTFAQIIKVRQTGLWDTDLIVISTEEATGKASLFNFISVVL